MNIEQPEDKIIITEQTKNKYINMYQSEGNTIINKQTEGKYTNMKQSENKTITNQRGKTIITKIIIRFANQ